MIYSKYIPQYYIDISLNYSSFHLISPRIHCVLILRLVLFYLYLLSLTNQFVLFLTMGYFKICSEYYLVLFFIYTLIIIIITFCRKIFRFLLVINSTVEFLHLWTKSVIFVWENKSFWFLLEVTFTKVFILSWLNIHSLSGSLFLSLT